MDNHSIQLLIDQLHDYYPVLTKIVNYEKVNKGMANLNFIVTTSNNKFFLKIVPETQKAYLPRQVSFYENIENVDISTISPIRNRDQKFVSDISEHMVMLFPYKDILEPSMTIENAQRIGQLLGKLHSVRVVENQLERSRYTKAFYREGLVAVDASRVERYASYAKYIDSLPDTLPKGFVFDDICPDNLYSDKNGIHGFIDPENAGYGEYIYDIAGAYIMSFYGRDDQDELMNAFLRGYSSKRELIDKEKDALFASCIFLCVLLSLFFEIKPGEKNIERINLRLGYADELINLGKESFTIKFFKFS